MDLDGLELDELEKVTEEKYLTLMKMMRLVVRELLHLGEEIEEMKNAVREIKQ